MTLVWLHCIVCIHVSLYNFSVQRTKLANPYWILSLKKIHQTAVWPCQIAIHKIPRAWLSLQWRHNKRDGVSNHRRLYCLLDRLFRQRSKKTSNLHITGLCAGNSAVTGEFPAQMASNTENVSISWRHHVTRASYNKAATDLALYQQHEAILLTHWGHVTHICVSKLTIIGLDNGLSPGRRQAIIWNNDGILLTGPLGTNFSEILIEICTFSVKKMHLKTSYAKWRPLCFGLNVLKLHSQLSFIGCSLYLALNMIFCIK